jgi:hypothetical protein
MVLKIQEYFEIQQLFIFNINKNNEGKLLGALLVNHRALDTQKFYKLYHLASDLYEGIRNHMILERFDRYRIFILRLPIISDQSL